MLCLRNSLTSSHIPMTLTLLYFFYFLILSKCPLRERVSKKVSIEKWGPIESERQWGT